MRDRKKNKRKEKTVPVRFPQKQIEKKMNLIISRGRGLRLRRYNTFAFYEISKPKVDFLFCVCVYYCVRSSDAVHERQYVKINLIKSLRRCLYKYIRLVRANHFVRVVAFRRTEWVGQTVPAATKAQNRFRRRFEIPLNPKPCVLLCARCRSPSKVHWAADNSGVNA